MCVLGGGVREAGGGSFVLLMSVNEDVCVCVWRRGGGACSYFANFPSDVISGWIRCLREACFKSLQTSLY